MIILSTCPACGRDVQWISCPTGGWWAHVSHPADNHAVSRPELEEWMDDQGSWRTALEDPPPSPNEMERT